MKIGTPNVRNYRAGSDTASEVSLPIDLYSKVCSGSLPNILNRAGDNSRAITARLGSPTLPRHLPLSSPP